MNIVRTATILAGMLVMSFQATAQEQTAYRVELGTQGITMAGQAAQFLTGKASNWKLPVVKIYHPKTKRAYSKSEATMKKLPLGTIVEVAANAVPTEQVETAPNTAIAQFCRNYKTQACEPRLRVFNRLQDNLTLPATLNVPAWFVRAPIVATPQPKPAPPPVRAPEPQPERESFFRLLLKELVRQTGLLAAIISAILFITGGLIYYRRKKHRLTEFDATGAALREVQNKITSHIKLEQGEEFAEKFRIEPVESNLLIYGKGQQTDEDVHNLRQILINIRPSVIRPATVMVREHHGLTGPETIPFYLEVSIPRFKSDKLNLTSLQISI